MYEDFLKEKQYITNVSPATLEWYKLALNWLPNKITERSLKDAVVKMRASGMKPRSVNSYRTAINSYLAWSGSELTMPKLQDEQKVPSTFSESDIQKLSKWKPKTYYEKRLHLLLLTLVDTGTRISEILNLKWADVDLDNNLMTVMGKGRKSRIIPFSFELRKHLFRWKGQCQLVFSTRDGKKKLMRRNVNRDAKKLCRRLEINPPERTLHALRHTYAINALRRGASVFHVQKQLGHTTLDMTRRYCNLNTDDLSKMHNQVSLLA